jgi:hypothetical protein
MQQHNTVPQYTLVPHVTRQHVQSVTLFFGLSAMATLSSSRSIAYQDILLWRSEMEKAIADVRRIFARHVKVYVCLQ